jgi:hypothetical protein
MSRIGGHTRSLVPEHELACFVAGVKIDSTRVLFPAACGDKIGKILQ